MTDVLRRDLGGGRLKVLRPSDDVGVYFSQSDGNDSFIGSSTAPLKTLAKAAAVGPYGPNSQILLKAGDTWVNDPLRLNASSHGLFAVSVFQAAYDSTFNTNNAGYLAGTLAPPNNLPTFQSFKDLLVTAGQSDSSATSDATDYCRRLAIIDALMAGHRAAQPASTWVVIGRYGVGANPVLDGAVAGVNTALWGIDLTGDTAVYGGGFKIIDIDIKNCLVAAIRVESNTIAPNGLWITSSSRASVDHITGVAFNAATHALITPIPGYTHHFTALGISAINIPYTFIEGYDVTNTDTPWFVGGAQEGVAYRMTATNSYYLHPYAVFGTRILVKEVTCDNMCITGIPSGKAGYIFSVNTDALADTLEVKNGLGNAIDMEGQNNKTMFVNCQLHDYGDAAVLHMSNGGQNVGTIFVKNAIARCAGVGVNTNANFIQTNPVLLNDHLVCVLNTIVRDPDQGFLFSGPTYSTSKTNTITDLAPNAVFGSDNVVS